MNRTSILAAVALATAAFFACDASAATPPAREFDPVAITAAKTKADHEAIAAAYDAEAAAADRKIKLHEAMLSRYQTPGGKPYMAAMANHCKALIKEYTEAAKHKREMAAEHRRIAATLP